MGIFDKLSEPTIKKVVKLHKKGDVEGLIDLLKYKKDPNVRVCAAGALGRLGQMGDKRVVKPLIHALKDEDKLVRETAAGALAKLG